MAFQLIIRNESDSSVGDFFRRGKRIEFQELPFIFPGDLLPEGVRLQLTDAGDGRHARLHFSGGCALTVNGEAVNPGDAPRALRSSDRICCQGTVIRFYELHGRPAVSWRANALGWLARIGVAAVVLLELFAIFALPSTLKHQQHWLAESEMQEIAWHTDVLRRKMARLDSRDPLVNTWLNAARDELVLRIRYLREHGKALDGAARQKMLQDLKQLDQIVERVAGTALRQEQEQSIKLDETIRQILEEK
ncbi:MAG: hypothetical protein J6S21_04925 [Victivallales bacterium]|nr:hypothetical protein [Victivallales bacterium]